MQPGPHKNHHGHAEHNFLPAIVSMFEAHSFDNHQDRDTSKSNPCEFYRDDIAATIPASESDDYSEGRAPNRLDSRDGLKSEQHPCDSHPCWGAGDPWMVPEPAWTSNS